MKFLQLFFVALVAFEHIYFMILEMFYWDKPKGLKAFGLTLEDAKKSRFIQWFFSSWANLVYNQHKKFFGNSIVFFNLRCHCRHIRSLHYKKIKTILFSGYTRNYRNPININY